MSSLELVRSQTSLWSLTADGQQSGCEQVTLTALGAAAEQLYGLNWDSEQVPPGWELRSQEGGLGIPR